MPSNHTAVDEYIIIIIIIWTAIKKTYIYISNIPTFTYLYTYVYT